MSLRRRKETSKFLIDLAQKTTSLFVLRHLVSYFCPQPKEARSIIWECVRCSEFQTKNVQTVLLPKLIDAGIECEPSVTRDKLTKETRSVKSFVFLRDDREQNLIEYTCVNPAGFYHQPISNSILRRASRAYCT